MTTRTRKTPAQRATKSLAVEERRVTKLGKLLAAAKARTEKLQREHDAAVKRRDFLAQSPDLPQTPARSRAAKKATPGPQQPPVPPGPAPVG